MTAPLAETCQKTAQRLKTSFGNACTSGKSAGASLLTRFAVAAGRTRTFTLNAAKRLRTSFEMTMFAGALASCAVGGYVLADAITTPTLAETKLARDCARNYHSNLPCTPESRAALKSAQESSGHVMTVMPLSLVAAFAFMCIGFSTPEMRRQPKPAAPKA